MAEVGFLASFARLVHVLILALWLGAGLTLALLVAPALDAHVESTQAARVIFRSLVDQLDRFALPAAPVLLLTLLAGWIPLEAKLRLRAALVLALSVCAALHARWVGPRISELLQALAAPIERLPKTDPLLSELRSLELASHTIGAAEMAIVFIVLVAAVRSSGGRRRSGGIEF